MPLFLKVLAAPEGESAGRKIDLQEGENLAGRVAPPCTLLLSGTKVSKKHCLFVLSGGRLRVEDLGSSNGVYVNGKQVTGADLKARDRLVVGDYTLEVGEG